MNLLPDTFGMCNGDVKLLEVTKKLEKGAKFSWNDPYIGIIENTNRIPVVKSGRYRVKVTIGKNVYYDSTFVLVSNKPRVQMQDTVSCKGKKLTLNAGNPGMRYLWNTGETTQKIKVETGGNYWVKVSNGGCSQYDTVNVKFVQGSVPAFNSEMSFCLSDEHKVLSVKAQPGSKIQWSTGSIYPSINITKEGKYWVKTENRSCGEQVDTVNVTLKACDCEMLIPNSFTPNEDNRNDYFYPVLQCEYSGFTMTIKDRWDNVVFLTNNPNGKWDGRFKGNLCPEEVYIYEIESTEKGSGKKQVRQGKVSLFR